jgi:hypothetical protein
VIGVVVPVSGVVPARNRDAVQLRAVAPLVVTATKELVAPVMLVTNGQKTIAVTSAELLRSWEAQQLSIATKLDCSELVPIATWGMGRYSGVGLVELASPLAAGPEVAPVQIATICATVDTRGAPAALVTITQTGTRCERTLVPVYVDTVDSGGGMSDDVITRLASPIDPAHETAVVDGAILFAWFPPDPVLGRKSEVLAVAMAYPYRVRTFQPRATPAIAELCGLDDLGRALISTKPAPRPDLPELTGEIVDAGIDPIGPVLDGLDEYRQKRERKP